MQRGLIIHGTHQSLVEANVFADVRGADPLAEAIDRLESTCERFDAIYGTCADAREHFNVLEGTGSLATIQAFVERSA